VRVVVVELGEQPHPDGQREDGGPEGDDLVGVLLVARTAIISTAPASGMNTARVSPQSFRKSFTALLPRP